MNSLIAIRVPLLLGLLLMVCPAPSSIADINRSTQDAPSAETQIESDWLPLAPEREEFSAVTPSMRTAMIMSANFHFEPGGEEVLEQRSYSGYENGFVFVIESFRAANPQKIFKSVIKNTLGGASFRRDVMVDGFLAKEYSYNDVDYDRRLCLVAKKHLYLLSLVARDEKNPGIERLLNSFKFGDHVIARTGSTENQLTTSSTAAGEVFSGKEVTRKARVVWKPEPGYTEQARHDQMTGSVLLKAILAASGQVIDITVVAGLKDGLNEKAIDAARNIRFFPAERDGRPVSQALQIEYNFRLY